MAWLQRAVCGTFFTPGESTVGRGGEGGEPTEDWEQIELLSDRGRRALVGHVRVTAVTGLNSHSELERTELRRRDSCYRYANYRATVVIASPTIWRVPRG